MIGSLLKMIAYSKAPRATFAVRHPVKALQWKKLGFDMRHAYAPRVAALGVAALALPIGFVLGRMNGHRHMERM